MRSKKNYIIIFILCLGGIGLVVSGLIHLNHQLNIFSRPREILVIDVESGKQIYIKPQKIGTTSRELNEKYLYKLKGKEIDEVYIKEAEEIHKKFLEDFTDTSLKEGYIPLMIVDAADTLPSYILLIMGLLSICASLVLFILKIRSAYRNK